MSPLTDSPQPLACDADPGPGSLLSTAMVDSDHPAVQEFAREHAQGTHERTRAVALYYAVRDGFRYDPYRADLTEHGMRASTVLEVGVGWCVTKATLLAAACRAAGIPARLGFANVRNHLSTERMRQTMKTDVFVWHGFSEIWLDGAWRKATPAFNIALCEKFGFLPLEFNLKTAATRAPRASAAGLAGRSDRRCAGRCRPAARANGRAWATAPQQP